jgi:hypothetical protein
VSLLLEVRSISLTTLECLTCQRPAQQQTSDSKDRFVNILKAWDKEHDTEAEKVRSRKNHFRKRDNLVSKVRANISEQHTWEEVFVELRAAQDAYNNPKRIRKWFRKAADESKVIEPFIDFIPDMEYTSVICASLKFILKVGLRPGMF